MSDEPQAPPQAPPLAGWTTRRADGAVVLRLQDPIAIGEHVRIEALTIPRIRAKHLRVMKSEDLDGLLLMLEAATGESRDVIDSLTRDDMGRALEVLTADFPAGPATGGAN